MVFLLNKILGRHDGLFVEHRASLNIHIYLNTTFSPASLTPFPSSSKWKRRFSSRKTEPAGGSAHLASTSAPTQSERNSTGLNEVKMYANHRQSKAIHNEQMCKTHKTAYFVCCALLYTGNRLR